MYTYIVTIYRTTSQKKFRTFTAKVEADDRLSAVWKTRNLGVKEQGATWRHMNWQDFDWIVKKIN